MKPVRRHMSDEDARAMQSEAIRRVQEMRDHAKRSVEASNKALHDRREQPAAPVAKKSSPAHSGTRHPAQKPKKSPELPTQKAPPHEQGGFGSFLPFNLSSMLQKIGIDKEIALILFLLIMLADEETDELLVLALLYLLL